MNRSRRSAIILFVVGVSLVLTGLVTLIASGHDSVALEPLQEATPENTIPLPSTISGTVVAESGPVAGAIVQMQGTTNKTQTAKDGTFALSGLSGTTPTNVTAWSAGHYVGWVKLDPSAPDWKGGDNLTITLRPLSTTDNPKYEWFSYQGTHGSAACGLCHQEYDEWKSDQHSRAAINHHFLNVYMGTDANGELGQEVQFNYDGKPLPIDPSKPYHGPGFRLDNPSRAGNCASCHTPMASTASNTQNCAWSGCHTSLTIERANGIIERPAIPSDHMQGDAAEGISCEFCHKTVNVVIDPKTGLPFPDMPGILSMELLRPKDDSQQVFFGTLVDVPRRDSYLPLLSQSQFCAGCHYGVAGGVVGMGDVKGGTVIYNSYGEWLDSPYSKPGTGKTCQQ